MLPLEKFKQSGIKIALFYETDGRMGNDFSDFSLIASDITYMAANYFGYPSYLYFEGKPVVAIYLTRVVGRNGTLEQVTGLMRDAARSAGVGEIYLIGDHVFRSPPKMGRNAFSNLLKQIRLLDAVTNYDVKGSSNAAGLYATQSEVEIRLNVTLSKYSI